MIGWFFGWLDSWFFHSVGSVGWDGRGWLIGWLAGWLVGRSVGWLAGCV